MCLFRPAHGNRKNGRPDLRGHSNESRSELSQTVRFPTRLEVSVFRLRKNDQNSVFPQHRHRLRHPRFYETEIPRKAASPSAPDGEPRSMREDAGVAAGESSDFVAKQKRVQTGYAGVICNYHDRTMRWDSLWAVHLEAKVAPKRLHAE